jgi:hypothetical protein
MTPVAAIDIPIKVQRSLDSAHLFPAQAINIPLGSHLRFIIGIYDAAGLFETTPAEATVTLDFIELDGTAIGTATASISILAEHLWPSTGHAADTIFDVFPLTGLPRQVTMAVELDGVLIGTDSVNVVDFGTSIPVGGTLIGATTFFSDPVTLFSDPVNFF